MEGAGGNARQGSNRRGCGALIEFNHFQYFRKKLFSRKGRTFFAVTGAEEDYRLVSALSKAESQMTLQCSLGLDSGAANQKATPTIFIASFRWPKWILIRGN